jgi:hypothetical protein
MSDTRDFVRGWLRKGDSDLAARGSIMAGAGPYDTCRGYHHHPQAPQRHHARSGCPPVFMMETTQNRE